MKTVIAGSRTITDYEIVKKAIQEVIDEHDIKITEVLSGTANGVDKLGERWAEENNIKITRYPAPWDDTKGKPKEEVKKNNWGKKYWTKAGFARNQCMAQDCDIAIIIHDNTRGSKSMIYEAKQANKTFYEKTLDDLMTEDNIGYVF